MGPTRVYLVRHGETTWNIERRYQGAFDSPLSARGREQSRRTRDALREVPLRAVYSSPLARAVDTARVIAEPHGLPVTPVEALREIRVGQWEGLTVAEIEANYAETASRWYRAPHLAQIPGGETVPAMRARAGAAVEEIRRRHAGEAVGVVARGITVLEWEGDRARVLILNATAHLESA